MLYNPYCIFELTSAIFVWRALRNFATDMANVVDEMVGTREAEAAEVATESGGAVATESGGAATTGDATADDDTAATCGVMYAVEGPYTIDVRHVEAMVGTTREVADGDRVRGNETATKPGTRPASQGRDRRQDGGDGW